MLYSWVICCFIGKVETVPTQLKYIRFSSMSDLAKRAMKDKMDRIGRVVRANSYQTMLDSIVNEHKSLVQEINNKLKDDGIAEDFPDTQYVYRLEGYDTNKKMTKAEALMNLQNISQNDYAALISNVNPRPKVKPKKKQKGKNKGGNGKSKGTKTRFFKRNRRSE